MAFDPSIISQIPDMAPNPVAAKEQGYKLADMSTQPGSNRLAFQQQKQQVADNEQARNILKGTKLDSPQDVTKAAEKLTDAGLHDQAMQFIKTMQGLQASKGELTLQQYKLMEAKNDIIGSAAASLVGQYDQMIQSGATPALAQAVMQPKYQQAIQQLSQAKLPDGTPALGPQDLQQIQQNGQFNPQFVRMIADRSKQGAAALRAQLEFHKVDTQDKAEKNRERATDIAARREEDYARSISDKEIQAKIKDEMKKAAILGPEDLEPMAKQYLAGDRTVLQNLGRGDIGATNMANMRRAIRTEAKAEGLAPADIAGRVAQFNSFMAEQRALGTRQAAIEVASTEASKVFPIVEKASLAVPREKWVPVNKIVQNFEKFKSDKDLARFAQAIDTTVNVYARAINPTGVPHEAARQRALALLSTATDQDAFQGVIDIMKSEIDAARTSPDQVRDDIMRSFKQSVAPKPGSPAAAATPPVATTPPGAGASATVGGATTQPSGRFKHLWNTAGAPQADAPQGGTP